MLKSDALSKCFSQHGTLVCPNSVTRRSQDISWLGLPWSAGSVVTFPCSHSLAPCPPPDRLYHLGGRHFLSTQTQTIQVNRKPFHMSSLAVYHIPCNHTSEQLPTGFGTCPKYLTISLALFRRKTIKYVPWIPSHASNSTIQLHYKSLSIPPPLKFNKSVINALDKTFHRIDRDLAEKIKDHSQRHHRSSRSNCLSSNSRNRIYRIGFLLAQYAYFHHPLLLSSSS